MVDGCVSSKFTSTEMNFLLVNLLDTFSFEEKQMFDSKKRIKHLFDYCPLCFTSTLSSHLLVHSSSEREGKG